MERILRPCFIAIACFGFSVAKADEVIFQQGVEQIVQISKTGEYIIDYIGNDGTLRSVRWTPTTNINVTVYSKFKEISDGIKYSYTIKNHKSSMQPVNGFRVLTRTAVKKNVTGPEGWRAAVIKNYDDPTVGVWADWFGRSPSRGVSPGKSQSGFEVVTTELLGAGIAKISGAMSLLVYPDEGPEGALINFMEDGGFLKKASGGVSRLAAIPRISVPIPFDAAVVLANIQKHVKDDMVSMQLIDPTLLTLIDRSLTQAIAAAQSGNTPSLLHEIKNMRKLLKQEHADVDKDDDGDRDDEDKEKKIKSPIDKLAARVLDFDLKYIEKRVKEEKD